MDEKNINMEKKNPNSITVSREKLVGAMAGGWAENPCPLGFDLFFKNMGLGIIKGSYIPIVVDGHWEFHSREAIDVFIWELKQARDKMFPGKIEERD